MTPNNKKRTKIAILATALVLFGAMVAFQMHLDSYGCKRAGSLRSPTSTPPELIQGALGCVQLKRYADAAYMLTLSDAFMRFDQKRVPDRSAHQVRAILPLTLTQQLSANDRQELKAGFATLGAANRKETVCRALTSTRAPTYDPAYMRNHGLAAFGGSAPTRALAFDPKEAWAATVADLPYCQN